MSEAVFLIVQHGYGLGHLSRISLLAEQLSTVKSFQVYLFSGGSSVPGYQQPENVQFIQLPPTTFVELTDTNYIISRPVRDNCLIEDIEKKRSQILMLCQNKLLN